MKALTGKQRRFVEAYNGNATEAAIAAGYSAKTAYSIGQRLLKNVEIREAIRAREGKRMIGAIAEREELQAFWTTVMRDGETDIRDRTRASELLGKSVGAFLERIRQPVEFPNIESAADLPRLTAAILAAVGRGDLEPANATAIASLVASHGKALELAELDRRISALEEKK
jgi:phage terminase small subunit